MFVDFFIKRPIFAAVCSMLLVLAGAICIPTLPIAQYPQVAPPQVVVTSTYIGASSEVVESAVTIPLEQAINGAEGMRYITSSSGSDGTSTITVTFEPSRNLDAAAVDVQNRVATAQARLPNEVKQTGITVTKSSSTFVLAIALTSETGRYDQQFISNYADVYIRDALKRVPGVGEVRIFGERRFAMRLWVDPHKLAERGLTASDVVTALNEQNLQVPAGQIGQPPAPPDKLFQIGLQVQGRLADEEQFGNIVLRASADGALVRVRDIGRTELGAEDYSTSLRFNGNTTVGLGVLQLPTANALSVQRGVLATLDRLSKRFPPGLKWVNAFDTTRAVAASVKEIVTTLGIAIALVVLVIFVFVQNAKSTLIPAVTIPVSLIGTFAFVKLFGFSINTLTLFGLTLATGLVVDDAIVVIENIQRFIDERAMDTRAASSSAMAEVAGAVIATSLVLIAVFAPVAFLPGTTGRIYQQFSLTIAFSVAISLFNSLTLTPALSARLLSRTKTHKNVVFRGFDRAFETTRSAYLGALAWLLRWRSITLIGYVASLAVAVWLFVSVPGGFLPEEDQGYFIVNVQGPSGTSLGYTQRVIEKAERLLHAVPQVQNTFAVSGFSFNGAAANRAIVFVTLKPWDERSGRGQTAPAIIRALQGRLLSIDEAIVLPFAPPAIQGVGTFGGFQFEVEQQGGGTIQELASASQSVFQGASRSSELTGSFTSFTADAPQLLLSANRERAKQLNIPLTDIFQTLQIYTGSQYVNDFTFANRSYRVYVQADEQFRGNPKDVTSFYVRSGGGIGGVGQSPTGLPDPSRGAEASLGSMVSLDNLLSTESRVTAVQIPHYNLFRSTEINGSPAPGRSSGEAIREMERIASTALPQGYGFEWTGIALEQIQAGNTTLLIFALALILVFLVLAAQYESFSLPFIVLLSVPLGLAGALAGQLIRGQPNDIFCQIGLVMLIGLSAKNAILIVQFAREKRELGQDLSRATLEAARERLRPILMTSFAFILGVVPLVFAKGSGAESRHSLGTTVFGGMLVSTVMNLFFVPALYAMFEALRERVLGRKKGGAGPLVLGGIWLLAALSGSRPARAEPQPPPPAAPSSPSSPLAAPSSPSSPLAAPSSPSSPAEPGPIVDPDLAPPPPASRVIANWEQALALLRSQAPGYAASYANIQRAEAASRIALAGVLPSLAGQGGYTHQFKTQTVSFGDTTVTIPPTDTFTVGATASWGILSPRALYGLGTAKVNERAAAAGFSEARRQIAVGLVRTMLGTLAAARIADQNRVGLRAALERLRLTETKVAFLQGTALDVDRAKQDVATSRAQLVNGDESLRQAREALGTALGWPVSVTARGTLDLDDFETAVARSCRASDELERRPDVAQARARLELANRAVVDTGLQFAPSLDLQSQAGYSTQVSFGPQSSWSAGAVLRVPIFDETRYGLLRDAEGAREQARAALTSARLNAIFDVEQRQRAVVVARQQLDIAQQQRDLAARIDWRTREGYSHGLGTSLDLVTSAQALRQAEINLVLATFQASQSRIEAVLANADCIY